MTVVMGADSEKKERGTMSFIYPPSAGFPVKGLDVQEIAQWVELAGSVL